MIWLFLSILCNTLLFIILRGYAGYGVRPFPAIIVNYFVAAACGLMVPESMNILMKVADQPWFYFSLVTGLAFISVFVLVSRAAITMGISTASVANKMSFIMPVLVGVIFFNEDLDGFRIPGFVLAMASVVLVSIKKNGIKGDLGAGLVLGIVVFLGSGVVDSLVNYVQQKFFTLESSVPFIAFSFLAAGTIGSLLLIFRKIEPTKKEIWGGLILGVPNFISIMAMMKAIGERAVDSGVLFAVCNLGVVLLSSFSSILLYREKLSILNWIGIALATGAILLVTFL